MPQKSQIVIAGIGGAGVSVLNDIADSGIDGALLVAVDTDADKVATSRADKKIPLIENGEGSGCDTSVAKEAAVAHAGELGAISENARLLILVAGLGGGTGSVVAPMISKLAAENPDCAVVSFAIMPLSVEGTQREVLAVRAQNYLSKRCRAAFALRNDIILARLKVPVSEAFSIANLNVVSAVTSLVKILTSKGAVNIEFPSFLKIFTGEQDSISFIAYGTGEGENSVDTAIERLMLSPLMPDFSRATSLIVGLRCGTNFEMNKMQMLLESVSEKFGHPERVAFGAITEDRPDETIEVCTMGLCRCAQKKQPIGAEPNEPEFSHEPGENENPDVSFPEAKDDTITSSSSTSVAVPPKVSPAAFPAPVLAEPEEKPARKSFFSFGKRKRHEKEQGETQRIQTEFEFMELSQQRGFFQDTPPNIRNGVDLDVPTYMRKGVKISLL